MASRLGATCATRHIQLRFLYIQDSVASGVEVDTKDNLAGLHTKRLGPDKDAELHHLSPLTTTTIEFTALFRNAVMRSWRYASCTLAQQTPPSRHSML